MESEVIGKAGLKLWLKMRWRGEGVEGGEGKGGGERRGGEGRGRDGGGNTGHDIET